VDVVFNNLRGDQPAKLGLTYSMLGDINRKIVCCSLNGFGSEGPRATEPGYDYLMQAYTGYMSITGDPCGPPAACGVSFIDHAAGFAAALGIVSALYAAERSGIGGDVEVSLLDTAYSMLTYLAIWNLNRGFEPKRYSGSAHQTLVPVQTFRTADGYITIFCGKEKFWQLLCEAFEEPDLATDPRFATFEARFKNREQVIEAAQEHFLGKTTCEWLQVLKGKVPCAPVHSLSQSLADPELEQRGTLIAVEHPMFGRVREANTPVRFCGRPRKEHRRGPMLGEDTQAILRKDLHYSDERIEALRQAGVVRF
jgi:crotonobetainyl-CoA:carnitine CoA-transferase CaiB-like acyl-CoA transferase